MGEGPIEEGTHTHTHRQKTGGEEDRKRARERCRRLPHMHRMFCGRLKHTPHPHMHGPTYAGAQAEGMHTDDKRKHTHTYRGDQDTDMA